MKILCIGNIGDDDGYSYYLSQVCQTLAHLGHDVKITGNSAGALTSQIFDDPYRIRRQATVEPLDLVLLVMPVPPWAYIQEVKSTWSARSYGLVTMWESQDRLPTSWAQLADRNFDFVLVPSPKCVELFKQDGCETALLPWLISSQGAQHTLALKPKRQDNVFTVYSSVNAFRYRRKLLDQLLQCWSTSLGKKDDCRLVVKLGPFVKDREDIDRLLQKSTNVIVREEPLPRDDMLQEYANADLCYYITAGEGLGLPPMEAALAGTQGLIGQCNDGLAYMHDSPVRCVRSTSLEEQLYWGGHHQVETNFQFARYRDRDVHQALLRAYRERDQVREEGAALRRWVVDNLTFEHNPARLAEFKSIIDQASQKKRRGPYGLV